MKIFKKFLGKLFSFTLITALILNVVLIPMVVKAQEASPSATETPQSTPAPSNTPAPTNTPEPSNTPQPTFTPEPSSSPPSSTPESTPSATLSIQTEPQSTPEPSSNPTPEPSVTLNTSYTYENMKVIFTKLPEQTGTISFSTKTLTESQADQVDALTTTVYEITSTMENGTFNYDLTLPLPPGVNGNNFKVIYAKSVSDLNNAREVDETITINNDNTFTIHNLNHFTVFVVVNPNTQPNCDAVTLGTVSGTTCFSTIQAAVDASSNGDTVTIGAGTYNETVNVSRQLTFTGQGNPVVTAFVLQTTPVTFTTVTAGSITIATPIVSLNNPVFSGNQTNVTITGTGAANSEVNYIIGSVSGTGVVASDGTINISGINVSSLPDGNLNLSVNLTYNGFTSSIATASSVKDTQAPALATNLSITNPIHNSNKTTIALSGNGEVNSIANWTVSNGAFSVTGTANVSAQGTFSANTIDVSSLPDGTLTLSVTLTDTAGNTNSAATTTSTKNTQAPTLTSVAISSSNANPSLAKIGDTANLTFTSSETIQTPVVIIAGHLVSPTNIGGDSWLASYTLTSSDTEGLVSFVIDFTDFVGNAGNSVNSTTNSSSITFDYSAPLLNSSALTSSNSNQSLAKVGDTITLILTASEGIQAPIVTIAGHSVAATNTSGNDWTASYNMATDDTEGLIAYTINYSDLAGNSATSVSTNSNITLDKTAPTLTSTSVTSSNANNSYAKVGDTIIITFTSSETIQTPSVTIAGQTANVTNVSGNDWSATYTMQSADPEGLISYIINFQDQSSNATTINTNSSINFDRTAPQAPSVIMTHAVNIANQTVVTMTGSGEIGAIFNYIITDSASNTVSGTGVVNSAGVVSASGINVSTLLDGTLTLSVTLTDQAGNTGSAGLHTASKDTVVPVITVTSVTSSNTNNSYAKVGDTVTVNFSTSETVNTPLVTITGHMILATSTSGNNWTASYIMASSDTEGLIAYRIIANDLSNNPAVEISADSTITFDKSAPQAPAVSLTNPVNDSNKTSVAISGTGEANTVFIWSINTISGTGTVDASGVISVTGIDVSSLADGTLTISVTLTDHAGNTGSAGTNTASKDTVAPIITSAITTSNTNTSYAKAGDTITISLTSSETIQSPVITIAGHTVIPTNTSGNDWAASYTMATDDTEGLIAYTIAFTDTLGNAGTTVDSNSAITFDKTAPSFSGVTISSSNANPNLAKVGDTITIDFTTSETVQTPVVSIAFQFATVTNLGGNNWRATYTMISSDTEGTIQYTINVTDLAGNSPITVPGASNITFDKTNPTIISQVLTTSNSNPNYAKTGDTVTLTFTSSEGIQAPNVTIAGHTLTATNTSGNNWTATYTMTASDTEGLVAYTIDFTDSAGNTGATINTNSTISFDKTTPTLPTITITTTNTNSLFAKIGDTITVAFIESEPIQTPVVTIAGHNVTVSNQLGITWVAEYTLTASDTEGPIAYTIAYQDAAGNAGAGINTASSITFDKTIPAIVGLISTTSSNANPNYAKVGDTITAEITFSETIQPLNVTISGKSATVTNISGNIWRATYTLTQDDVEGLVTITFGYSDLASNSGIPVDSPSAITFDKTAPASSADNVISGWFTSNPTITLTVSDAGGLDTSKVRYMWDGVATATDGTVFINGQTINIPGEGSHILTLYIEDNAGNVNNSFSQVYKLDTVIPSDPNDLSTTTPTNSTTQTWSWTAATDATSGIQVYMVSIDGAIFTSIGNVTSYITNLSAGSHTLRLVVYDNAGNSGSIVSYSVLVDNIAPTGSWTQPQANTNVSGNVTLAATAIDSLAGIASVTFSYKRSDGVDTFHDIAGNSWDTNALALDNYTLRLTVTDNAGNTTIVDQTVGVATVISSGTIQAPVVTSNSITITWTTDDPTSSRVIYDTSSNSSLGAAPNYGYANSSSTQDISTKVTNHSVVLSGLSSGTKYYYRVISAGSPETVSEELNFTTVQAPAAQGGTGGASTSSGGAPVCTDVNPGSAPALLSVKITGRNKVTLVWNKAKDPVTYYLIKYGLGHDSYQFGVPNVGNVGEYEIGDLAPGVTYYFRVRAGNNCAPGEYSNEIAVKNSGSFVAQKVVETISSALGATTTYASEKTSYSSEDRVTNITSTGSSIATQSTLEATASTEPVSSAVSSPATIINKGSSGWRLKNIVLTTGLILLVAGGITYYRSKR